MCRPLEGQHSTSGRQLDWRSNVLPSHMDATPSEQQPQQHWPDVVIKNIATHLSKGPERTALLHLVAMCGVSSHWRSVARHLDTDTTLRFDSLDSFAASLSPLESKFRRAGSAANWPVLSRLQRLHLVAVNLQDLSTSGSLLRKVPGLEALVLDGPASNLRMATLYCPNLVECNYRVPSEYCIDAALYALSQAPQLQVVELTASNFAFMPEQLRAAGALDVSELRIDSQLYKEQPSVTRTCYSHVDNEGVRALVDSICKRWTIQQGSRPFKLSLCGASSLTHDAVAALLRLPMLTELNIGGCARLTAMDKMRLVAKVKAGREQLESGLGSVRRHRHNLIM
ncbi:hypothetical protein WJX72_007280 [[Myrmecia] bisecta]|uniref:F-box domain-containing protein n=1 Tax=[Myrmecia] bisecta TaxID=41462 RepID=A0AAW1Q6K1_9CHLO